MTSAQFNSHFSRQCLVVTLLSEQEDQALAGFQVKILNLAKDGKASGIVIDLSALEIVDRYMAKVLADTSRMAGLLGIGTRVVGIKPAAAASLVALGHNPKAFKSEVSLETAIQMLAPPISAPLAEEDESQSVEKAAEEPEEDNDDMVEDRSEDDPAAQL